VSETSAIAIVNESKGQGLDIKFSQYVCHTRLNIFCMDM
jgi:hypothetical protein